MRRVRKHLKIISVLLLLSIGVALGLHSLRGNTYDGLTTHEWLLVLSSGDGKRADVAAGVLRKIPKEELHPVLREWMSASESKLRKIVREWLTKQSLVDLSFASPESKRAAAYDALAFLGPDATALIPELRITVNRRDTPDIFNAAFALVAIGPEGRAVVEQIPATNGLKADLVRAAAAGLLKERDAAAQMAQWKNLSVREVRWMRARFNRNVLEASYRNWQRRNGGLEHVLTDTPPPKHLGAGSSVTNLRPASVAE